MESEIDEKIEESMYNSVVGITNVVRRSKEILEFLEKEGLSEVKVLKDNGNMFYLKKEDNGGRRRILAYWEFFS